MLVLIILQKSRFAVVGQPLRLAGEPLSLYRADAAIQGGDIVVFQTLSYGEQLRQP